VSELLETLGLSQLSATPSLESLYGTSSFSCPVCFDDFADLSQMVSLSCGHFYCIDCFVQYLATQISDGGGRSDIRCPSTRCRFLVDQVLLSSLLDAATYERWRTYLVNVYVREHQQQVKWCPGKGCKNAIWSQETRAMVRCSSCGTVSCFGCLEDGHWPASCEQMRWWKKERVQIDHGADVRAQEQSAAWIAENTVPCTQCGSPILRNGG
jgi:ariadne-1